MSDTQDSAPIPPTPPRRNWPRYKAGPVEYWLSEAFTQFVNGFIAGWKHGVGTGAGTGILTGATNVADSLSATQQIMVSGGATLFAMVMSGISQVSDWHKTTPFPNPWPAPSGKTGSPFPPAAVSVLLLCALLPFVAGCVHIPPGSASEVHSSTSYLGVVSTSADLTDIKVTNKTAKAGTAAFHVQVLGVSHTTTAKDLVLTNPTDK